MERILGLKSVGVSCMDIYLLPVMAHMSYFGLFAQAHGLSMRLGVHSLAALLYFRVYWAIGKGDYFFSFMSS